ncbi:Rft-1-domain-containing protein [Serendipita vermifera]|nr:Rft-1-domain-containing protein [Serendipita vermifera]
MASEKSSPNTNDKPTASRFLVGASSLVLLQILTRVVTFLLNQALVRLSTPQVFGTASIQFELLLSTILFISREGVRLALLRSPGSEEKSEEKGAQTGGDSLEDEKEDEKGDSKARHRRGKTSHKVSAAVTKNSNPNTSLTATSKRLLVSNIATLPFLLGLPLSIVLAIVYTSTASSETSSQPYFRSSIMLYTVSALLQLAAEPLYILAQQNLDFNTRVKSEAAAVLSRAGVTVGTLVLAQRMGKVGEKAMGDGDEWGLLAFALGQLAYGFFTLGTFLWTYRARSQEWRWVPRSVKQMEKGHFKSRVFDRALLRLSSSMTMQSIVKHLLTEGDKLAVSRTSKLADQGGYAVASNYGSLVARIIFQPFEEIARVYFSTTLAVCTMEQDKATGDKTSAQDPPPVGEHLFSEMDTSFKVTSIHHTSDSSSHSKTLSTEQKAALIQASSTLHALLLLQSHLLLILLTFLPPYLPILLAHFLPKKYLVTSAPSILQAYAYYLPTMSLNGLLEAFAFSVMSTNDIKGQARWLLVTSVSFGVCVWLFCDRLGQGEVGLVFANVVSLGMRAAWAALFANNWFKRMWDHHHSATTEKNKDSYAPNEVAPRGISLRQVLPPITVLIAFAVSSQITRFSQGYFQLSDDNLRNHGRDREILKAQAEHIIVGGICGVICLLEAYRSQRDHIKTLIAMVSSRSKKPTA